MNSKFSVFITGGTSGLGLGLAKKYLSKNYTVGTCSFEKYDDVKDILPTEVKYFEADVTNSTRMKEVISEFANLCGRLDLVIASAGINHPKTSIPDFEHGTKVININVNGVLNTFGPSIEIMKNQGYGQLAAMSSIAGVIGGLPKMAIYGASKAAVLSLCETLAIDLAPYKIRVTILAPGYIDTPLTKNNQHSMPFLMSTESAVDKIFKAIQNKKRLYIFPWQLNIIVLMLRFIPRSFLKYLLQN